LSALRSRMAITDADVLSLRRSLRPHVTLLIAYGDQLTMWPGGSVGRPRSLSPPLPISAPPWSAFHDVRLGLLRRPDSTPAITTAINVPPSRGVCHDHRRQIGPHLRRGEAEGRVPPLPCVRDAPRPDLGSAPRPDLQLPLRPRPLPGDSAGSSWAQRCERPLVTLRGAPEPGSRLDGRPWPPGHSGAVESYRATLAKMAVSGLCLVSDVSRRLNGTRLVVDNTMSIIRRCVCARTL